MPSGRVHYVPDSGAMTSPEVRRLHADAAIGVSYRDLKTHLSELERQFIERRINEGKSALVAASSFPLTLKIREPMFPPAA